MCSWQSVYLRHWALLGPFKNSPYYVPLTNTQMPFSALLAKSDFDSRDTKRAAGQEGEHPVGAVSCFVFFLMQTVSWIWTLWICPLLSFTHGNSQCILPGWRLMRGKERVLWERTESASGAMRDARSCSYPEHDDGKRPDPDSSIWSNLELLCCVCLFICAWQQTNPCPRKHWNKHGFTGERFCLGGITPRLSKVLLPRQIKPIRKPPEMWAVLRLLFPPLDISCYCSCDFLWVSMGLEGGAATAGKGFWEGH